MARTAARALRAEGLYLLLESTRALMRAHDTVWASMVKQTLMRKHPSFSENYHGYSTFSKMVEDAVGLGLHLGTAGLVYLLARRVGAGDLAAFIAAAVFAIHGSRPESVVWIVGWFGVLATLFLLAALLLFLRDLARPHPLWSAASLLCALLAMWSKECAFAFPLLATLLAWACGLWN